MAADSAEECEIGEGKEGLPEAKPEIELEFDPFELSPSGPDDKWAQMIRSIKPKKPEFLSPDDQMARIRELIQTLDNEPPEPTKSQVAEASDLLGRIESLIPDHENFVASGFSHCYPAWHELLKGVGRGQKRIQAQVCWDSGCETCQAEGSDCDVGEDSSRPRNT
jgi:hypothetical protein